MLTYWHTKLTWTLTSLLLIISTMPTTSSKTRPSFLQLSAETGIFKIIQMYHFCLTHSQPAFRKLCFHTYSDWVDLSLYMQSAVVALKGIYHLFKLCITDHKTLSTLLVLLLVAKKNWFRLQKKQEDGKSQQT